MTKQQEIEETKMLAEKLGEHSYLGDWLNNVAAEVESMIRSDTFPNILPSNSAKQAEAITIAAKKVAHDLVKSAREESARIIRKAEDEAFRIRIRLIGEMEAAINKLKI